MRKQDRKLKSKSKVNHQHTILTCGNLYKESCVIMREQREREGVCKVVNFTTVVTDANLHNFIL